MINAEHAESQALAVLDAELQSIYDIIIEAASAGELSVTIDAPTSVVITEQCRCRLAMLGFRLICGDETCGVTEDDWRFTHHLPISRIAWGNEDYFMNY